MIFKKLNKIVPARKFRFLKTINICVDAADNIDIKIFIKKIKILLDNIVFICYYIGVKNKTTHHKKKKGR